MVIAAPLFILSRKDHSTLLIDGVCFPRDKTFIVASSIGSFYIPLIIMVATYSVTIRLLNARAAKHRKGMNPKGYVSRQKLIEKGHVISADSQVSVTTYATETDEDNRATIARMLAVEADDVEMESLIETKARRFELTPMNSLNDDTMSFSGDSSDIDSVTRSPLKKSSSDNHAAQHTVLRKPINNRVLRLSRSLNAAEEKTQSTSFLYLPDSPQPANERQHVFPDSELEDTESNDEIYDLRCDKTSDDRDKTPTHVSRHPLLVAQRRDNFPTCIHYNPSSDWEHKPGKVKKKANRGRHERANSKLMHIVNSKSRNERKASQTLGIIFAVFMILWCPFFVSYVTQAVCEPCKRHITSDMISAFTWLGYCSSMVNPFIYSMFNRQFRTAFGKILKCRCREFKEAKVSTTYITSTYA